MNLSGIRDVNELKRLLAAGQISQDDLNNAQLSGSFGPDQMPPPQQMPVQGTQNALQDMMNPGPQDQPQPPQMPPQTAQQQPPDGSNYVRNEQTGHITYLTPQGLSDSPSMGAVIQHSPVGAPSGGSAYTGTTQMMPQKVDPNAPAVTRVLGSGNGTTVDLGAAQQGETSRPALASGRNPIDIPGAGRGYYGTDGNAYVPNGDGSWTKVVLGYDMQGSMALNKNNLDMADKRAQITQSQAATAHTQEETRASRVNNPDWLGLDSGGGVGADGVQGSGPAGIDLSKVPPGILQQAQAMANGDMQLPMTRNGKLNPIAALAFQINPNLKQTDYVAKQSTTQDFSTKGKSGQVVQAINQALHHASTVSDAIDALNNSNFAPGIVNPVVNTFEQKVGGDVRQGNFSTAANALSEELKKIYAGGGGSLTELQNWQKSFDPNAGQNQQRSYLAQGMQLLQGAIQSRAEAYQRGMGPSADFGQLFSPQAMDALQKLQSKGYIQAGTTPTPQAQSAPTVQPISDPGLQAKALFEARQAIARGAPRDKVMQRLQQAGINSGL